jgi:hypothetical protein
MAIEKVTDVLITWDLPPIESADGSDFRLKREILMTPNEHNTLMRAVGFHFNKINLLANVKQSQCNYKPYKYVVGDITSSMDRFQDGANPPNTQGHERGGFYAVVPLKLYDDFVKLAETYHGQIDIMVVLEPRLLSAEELQEMDSYNASRLEESKKLVEEIETKEEEERKAIEFAEYQKRRGNTLAAAREREKETARRFDLRDGTAANADHESQYKWDHWIRTKQMTDWYN